MHNNRRTFLGGLTAMGGLSATGAFAATNPCIGTWSGTLLGKLRLKLVIASETQATMYSLDQGGAPIAATGVTVSAGGVTLAFASLNATYVATLSGDTLKGTLTQNGQALPLDFARGDLFPQAAPPQISGALTPEALAKVRSDAHIPGIGAAWAKGGAAATILVDGVRTADAPALITSSDQWHLGSITKSMTATVVARMIEKGGLTWDTTIGSALGTAIPDMNAVYKPLTLRHLLSHHAGLPGNIEMSDFNTFSHNDGPDPRPERLKYAALALKQTPVNTPGTAMLYSNSGFIVAGAILEAVYKKPWETLITEQLFAPLRLGSAGFGPPGANEPVGHAIAPDDPAKRVPVRFDNPVALGPAGRVHMDLADLVTYLDLHLKCPQSFLRADTWKTLHTPPFEGNYAMGWVVQDGKLWHNGSNTLWYAEIMVDPAAGTVAAAACNDGVLGEAQPAVNAALKAALLRASA